MEKKVAGDWETCIFHFRMSVCKEIHLIESSVHLGLGKIAANKLEFSHDLPSCIDESVCTSAHMRSCLTETNFPAHCRLLFLRQ